MRLIWLFIVGVPIFLIFYHSPEEISRSYSAMEYSDDEFRPVSITLNLTMKKRLFSKHLIDGTVEIDGNRFEVSNHLAFNEDRPEDDGKVKLEDSRNPLEKLRERLNAKTYELRRRIVGYEGYRIKDELVIFIETTKDFKYLNAYRPNENNNGLNYIAPANNMDDVKGVSKVFY
ncbi:hypothetical protein [Paenibacillus sp. GCM10028914]|uniref:hypothetical protein n=1 Tax=Paenibacillus sp. GCM10028914 TaxID=3273416 RepID=UPI0036D39CA3